jgi:hypothetical protein
MKTSKLQGPALDWAVARAWYGPEYDMSIPLFDDGLIFQPSALWQHGGPIIERERIDVLGMVKGETGPWTACLRKKDEAPPWRHITEGPTPLIAAMRCFVTSRLGDDVTVPDGLV